MNGYEMITPVSVPPPAQGRFCFAFLSRFPRVLPMDRVISFSACLAVVFLSLPAGSALAAEEEGTPAAGIRIDPQETHVESEEAPRPGKIKVGGGLKPLDEGDPEVTQALDVSKLRDELPSDDDDLDLYTDEAVPD